MLLSTSLGRSRSLWRWGTRFPTAFLCSRMAITKCIWSASACWQSSIPDSDSMTCGFTLFTLKLRKTTPRLRADMSTSLDPVQDVMMADIWNPSLGFDPRRVPGASGPSQSAGTSPTLPDEPGVPGASPFAGPGSVRDPIGPPGTNLYSPSRPFGGPNPLVDADPSELPYPMGTRRWPGAMPWPPLPDDRSALTVGEAFAWVTKLIEVPIDSLLIDESPSPRWGASARITADGELVLVFCGHRILNDRIEMEEFRYRLAVGEG